MKCEEFMSLLPMFPDGLQADRALEAFRKHAEECADCGARLYEHQAMLTMLKAMDEDVVVPQEFSKKWRDAIVETKRKERVASYHMRNRIIAAAASFFLIMGTVLMREGILFPNVTPNIEMQSVDSSDLSVIVSEDEDTQGALPAPMTMMSTSFESMEGEGDAFFKSSEGAFYELEEEEAFDGAAMMEESAGGIGMQGDGTAPFSANEGAEAFSWQAVSRVGDTVPSASPRTISIQIDTFRYAEDVAQIETLIENCGGIPEEWVVTGEEIADAPNNGRHALMTVRIPSALVDFFTDSLSTIGEKFETTQEDGDVPGGEDTQYTIVYLSVREVAQADESKAPFVERVKEAFRQSASTVRVFAADMLLFVVRVAPYVASIVLIACGCFAIKRFGIRKVRNGRSEQK